MKQEWKLWSACRSLILEVACCLQALAEAEAELAAGVADPSALARRDSAHELDETRSSSPSFRRSQSAGSALQKLLPSQQAVLRLGNLGPISAMWSKPTALWCA